MSPQNRFDDLLQHEELLQNPYVEQIRTHQQESEPLFPTTADANPYVEQIRRRQQDTTVALKSSITHARTVDPDATAKAARIAARLNVPLEMVERNPDLFAEQDTAQSFPYRDLQQQTPQLAEWLSTPFNAAVSNDDLPQMTAFERALQIGSNVVRSPVAGIYSGITAGPWGMIAAGAELAGFPSVAAYATRVSEASQQTGAAIGAPRAGVGHWESVMYGGLESVGQSLASYGVGVLTANPLAVSMGIMGIQTGGQAFTQARTYPGRPVPLPSTASALTFGAIQGELEILTELIPGSYFLGDLAKNAGLWKTILHQVASEVPTEQAATILQDLNEWFHLRPTAPFSTYLAERPSAAADTLVATIVAAGVQSGAGIGTQRLVERLGATAAASSTVKRAPEAAEDFLAKATKDTPLETHYADFDTWVTYWHSKGMDPAQVAAAVTDDPQAFDPITKAAIPLPTAKWVVRMGPTTEHNAFWAKELREEPNSPNARETEEFAAAVPIPAVEAVPSAAPVEEPGVPRETAAAPVTVGGVGSFTAGMEAATDEELATYLDSRNAETAAKAAVEVKRRYTPQAVAPVGPAPSVTAEDAVRAATDAAIARAEGQVAPLFTDAATMGVSEEQFATYRSAADAVPTQAREQLHQQVQRETQREATTQYRRARQTIRAAVTAELQQQPVYRARAAMRAGTHPDGSPLIDGETPQPLKGESRELVAEMFGFSSADELNQALKAAPPLKRAITQETARRLAVEQRTLVMDPQRLAESADAAIYGEGRATVVREELSALTRLSTALRGERRERAYERRWLEAEAKLRIAIAEGHKQVEIDALQQEVDQLKAQARQAPAEIRAAMPEPRVLKTLADQRVRQMRVRDLKPSLYLAAVHRASRLATEAAARQDIAGAIQAKQEELFSLALYRATRDAKVAADKVVPWVQRHDTTRSRARIGKAGESNIDQWDALLHQYEFKNTTQKVLDRRASLRNWMESQQALGLDIDLPTRVLNETQRVNYRELTVDDLESVMDGLRQVIQFSYFKHKLLEKQQRRDLKIKSAAVVEQLYATVKSGTPAARLTRSRGMLDDVRKRGKNLAASFLSPDTLLRELDNWTNLGPVYTHLKGGIDQAIIDVWHPRVRQVAETIQQINSVYKPGDLQKRVYIESLRDSISKEEVLAVALNWGSVEGRAAFLESKLFERLGASEATVQEIFTHLDQRDVNYIQAVWTFNETFWPEIAESQRRRKGIIPKKVDALPFMTPVGQVSGGYYHLQYDKAKSILPTQQDIDEVRQRMQLGRYVGAATRDGFAKEREGSAGQAVLLSLTVIGQHINEVLYDLTVGDAIRNADRILRSTEVRDAFEATDHLDAYHALELWLDDVAVGEIVAGDTASKMLRGVRTGVTGAALLWNMSSAIVQPTGLAQTFVVLKKRDAFAGLVDLLIKPKWGEHSIFKQVTDASALMRERQGNQNADMRTAMRTIQGSRLIPEWFAKAGYYAWTKMQWLGDVATWLGAYRQGLREFEGDTKQAQVFADRMVIRAQSTGLFSERSAFERGSMFGARQSELVKAGTMLGAYMFAKANVFYEKTKRTNFKNPASVIGYMVDLILLFAVERMLIDLIRGGGPDDDESYAWWVLKSMGLTMLGTIPFAREFGSELEGFRGGGPLESLWQKSGALITQVGQLELDKALLKAISNETGIFIHGYPSSAINRFIEAQSRAEAGEDVSLVDYFITPPKQAAGQ